MHTLQEGISGVNGRTKHMHGKNAEHKYVKVLSFIFYLNLYTFDCG